MTKRILENRGTGSWIRSYTRDPEAEAVRLFCFPHAGGGGSAYRDWRTDLPDAVGLYAVTLPGREDRLFEPPSTDLQRIVDDICRAMEPMLDRPFAIFGHSLGALVGAEVATALRDLTGQQPIHLLVSGCQALPAVADPEHRHLWSDADLMTLLRELNGSPVELLDSPEFARLLLRAFRADLALIANYRFQADGPLDAPITAFGGEDDPVVSPADLHGWAAVTHGPMTVVTFPGDHFYLRNEQAALVRAIVARIGGSG